MKNGFSLVELIVVLVIISVGFGALLMAVQLANVNNAQSQFMTVALELAQGKMEEILYRRMQYGFNYIGSVNFPPDQFPTDPSPGIDYPSSVTGRENYRREVDIYNVNLSDLNSPTGMYTGYKRIRVTVTSRVGIQGKAELVTVISDCETGGVPPS